MNIGDESGAITVFILAALFVFGLGFNKLVTWANENGYSDGYTWVLVVIGVLATIIGYAFMPGRDRSIPLLLACFFCSGAPMVFGDMARYAQARKRTQERIAQRLDD